MKGFETVEQRKITAQPARVLSQFGYRAKKAQAGPSRQRKVGGTGSGGSWPSPRRDRCASHASVTMFGRQHRFGTPPTTAIY